MKGWNEPCRSDFYSKGKTCAKTEAVMNLACLRGSRLIRMTKVMRLMGEIITWWGPRNWEGPNHVAPCRLWLFMEFKFILGEIDSFWRILKKRVTWPIFCFAKVTLGAVWKIDLDEEEQKQKDQFGGCYNNAGRWEVMIGQDRDLDMNVDRSYSPVLDMIWMSLWELLFRRLDTKCEGKRK